MALEHRWSKCITLEGNYVEKEEADLNRNKLDWSIVRNRSFDTVILKNMRKSRMFKLGKKYRNNLFETSEISYNHSHWILCVFEYFEQCVNSLTTRDENS